MLGILLVILLRLSVWIKLKAVYDLLGLIIVFGPKGLYVLLVTWRVELT